MRLKKILFPTDFSEPAERAFTHAANIAATFEAEIHALHVKIRQNEAYPALEHLLEDQEDSSLDQKEQVLPFPNASHDLVIKADATDSSACNAIVQYIDDHDIDLVVMGSHGRRGPARVLLGSTAECVIRNSHCPVLTLRSSADTRHNDEMKHILVPMDFSKFSQGAVAYANALAIAWQAKVTLVHVIEEVLVPTVYGVEAMTLTLSDPLIEKSNEELNKVAAQQIDAGIETKIQTLIGSPASTIAAYAKEEWVDLIVLASHGLTGIKRFLMGSVAESLNRKAPCPVLTVKPFGKSLIDESEIELESVH